MSDDKNGVPSTVVIPGGLLSEEKARGLAHLEQLVTTRRSIRRYQDRPVPRELILKALDIATRAPSSGGRQGWMFYVVESREVINRIAGAVEARTELMASWPESAPFREAVERWRRTSAFFRKAPVVIAACMLDYRSTADQVMRARGEQDPRAREMIEWRQAGASRLQTVAAAVAYLLLALHQMGLGACWMAGPLQAKGDIEQILNVPPDQQFAALIPVGWPAEEPKPPVRKSLRETVKVIT